MFEEEARLAAQLDHPNVAKLVEAIESNGTLFLVLEWIDGVTFRDLLEGGGSPPLPLACVLSVIRQAALGLHAAHELSDAEGLPFGLVHRDVSPQNLLVTTDGVAKLIDFGVAKAVHRRIRDTSPGALRGKIHYMAPEQAIGGSLDRRADVFALGAVLFHALAGDPPYAHDNEVASLNALLADQLVRSLPDETPEPIRRVAMRALAHAPADRFATARAMADALGDAADACGLTLDIAPLSVAVRARRDKAPASATVHVSKRPRTSSGARRVRTAAAVALAVATLAALVFGAVEQTGSRHAVVASGSIGTPPAVASSAVLVALPEWWARSAEPPATLAEPPATLTEPPVTVAEPPATSVRPPRWVAARPSTPPRPPASRGAASKTIGGIDVGATLNARK